MDEPMVFISDIQASAIELWKPIMGALEVGILEAFCQ